MDCSTCRAQLSGFLDGALAGREAAAVSAHLSACPACREHLAGLERVDRAVEDLAAPVPPRAYLEELRRRVEDRIGAEPVPAPGRRAVRDSRSRLRLLLGGWPRLVPVAAAAVVAVAILRFVDLRLPGAVEMAERQLEQQTVPVPEARPPGAADLSVSGDDVPEALSDREADRARSAQEVVEPAEPDAAPPEQVAGALEDRAQARDPAPTGEPERKLSKRSPGTWGGITEAEDRGPVAAQREGPAGESEGLDEEGGVDARLRFDEDGAREEAAARSRNEAPPPDGRAAASPSLAESGAGGAFRGPEASRPQPLDRAWALIEGGRLQAAGALLDSLAGVRGAPRDRISTLSAEGREPAAPLPPSTTRDLVAAYAALADSLPPADPARAAAGARSARLALELFALTGTAEDCRLAADRARAFLLRHPGARGADSLRAARAALPCAR